MEGILIAVAGIAATTAMVLVMYAIHAMKWANADMVRAIGSIYTRSYEMSLLPGLVSHYAIGIAFSFLYAMLIGVAPVSTGGGIVIIALLTGLVHGIVMSLFLAVMVAEHHPLPEFRSADVGVIGAHVAGHVVYGATLGICLALAGAKQTFLVGLLPSKVASYALDFVTFAEVWVVLFGMPMLFIGYAAYMAITARVRSAAHEAEERHAATATAAAAAATKKAA
jgi:hypothetical protein